MWLEVCTHIFQRHRLVFKQFFALSSSSVIRSFLIALVGLLIASYFLAQTAKAQNSNQTLTETPHDAAVALNMLPFSIGSMKTEAVVLTQDLLSSTPVLQAVGRSALVNPDTTADTKLTSTDLLHKVIQPPHRTDFELNGSVAIVQSSRSPVVENFGVWEAPNFYEVEKLIFDRDGYLIAQRSYYHPEEIPKTIIEKEGNWFSRLFRSNKNETETDATANENTNLSQGRKVEGCYALDIDFETEGFDCFDADKRILSVTEWNPAGNITKKNSFHLHADGPWISQYIEENLIAPKYRIERYYDFNGNLIEFKRFETLQLDATPNEHLRFFYNDSGQRVTEAVLNPATSEATDCKFMIYGYFNTLESIRYYQVKQAENNQDSNENNDSQAAFRSTLSQQSYTCEKEIPSILEEEKSTVLAYGWLYDSNNDLAGRRKQEISHYDANGRLIERTLFSYLESTPTRLAKISKYDNQGTATASIVFNYDKQGRLVKEERFQLSDDGNTERLLELTNYAYQAKESTLLEKTVEDYEHSRSKSVQSFDEAGNLIREQRYELFNRFAILNNMFRLKSDISKSYTGRSFVNELVLEEGNNKLHESYTYVYDYGSSESTANAQILNWIQKDEGSFVKKFDSNYSEPHHTNARVICYYPDPLAFSPNLVCNSPFE